MGLDSLVENKGGDIDKERERGECPQCEKKGEQKSEIEWKCTTSPSECDILYWFDWKTEMVDIDE